MLPRKAPVRSGTDLSLYIDTTVQNEATVAVVSDRMVARLTQAISFEERDDLLRHIDKLVRRAKISRRQLSSIVVVRGPGPFTATRVGVTVANALGLSLGIPVRGVKKTGQFNIAAVNNQKQRRARATGPVLPFYDRAPNITMPRKK